jgi:hypothetical protein
MEIAKIGDKINNTIRIRITEANRYFGFMNKHIIPPAGNEIEPISKKSKCSWLCCETVQNAHILGVCSAFSPFCAPDSRDFAKLNLLFLNPNLIFEIGSNYFLDKSVG